MTYKNREKQKNIIQKNDKRKQNSTGEQCDVVGEVLFFSYRCMYTDSIHYHIV